MAGLSKKKLNKWKRKQEKAAKGPTAVRKSAQHLIGASRKIVKLNILEAAMKMRKNYAVEKYGFVHSYGLRERSRKGTRPETIRPSKTKMKPRDIKDALRLDTRLRLNGELRAMLNSHLAGTARLKPPKPKKRKTVATS